jgi:glycosyltransferase involved in cell wall biosynthesis
MGKDNMIAYVLDHLITCGGTIVPFSHCRELRRRNYDAFIVANTRNEDLERSFPEITVKSMDILRNFTPSDTIIAVWWPQVEKLSEFEGRKIQFVQGNDLKAYVGDDWKAKCIQTRQRVDWEVMAVSKYAGKWTNRPFTVIPNAIDERFFNKLGVKRDIDILIEGNDEPNKGIPEAIQVAKRIGTRIAWLGRQTHEVDGVERFTNPPQEDIPGIYQRAKVFLKFSESEGFCLPILEAMASGCLVVTHDMGGNDFCEYGKNCLSKAQFNSMEINQQIVDSGLDTAKKYTWKNSGNILQSFLG